MSKTAIKTLKMIALFLVPGVIIATAYALLTTPILNMGYPNMMALAVVGFIVLIPLLLGILYFNSKKELGVFSIRKMMTYHNPIAVKHYLWLVPLLIAWAVATFTLLKPLDTFLKASLFSWVPESFILSADFSMLSKQQLLVTFLLTLFCIGILAPVTEEIYFRGFLLPRMEWMGWAAPIVNAFLFSLYHFWSPWQAITRFVALLPFCYVAYKTKNIKIPIIVHCLLNICGDALVILILYLQA